MFKQKPTAPFDTGSRFPSPYRIREPRGRAERCAAPVGLLPSSAFPRLSPTRPSAQRCRKPPTERPAPPAARPCAHRSFPGGAQKARSHRTRARLTSPPPGFLEALYKSLPPTKTKGRQQKQAPHAPGTFRFAPAHRVTGLQAAPGRSHSPPTRARRTPTSAAFSPHSPRRAAFPAAGRLPKPLRAAIPRGGSAAPARTPEPPGTVGPGRERSRRARRRTPLL